MGVEGVWGVQGLGLRVAGANWLTPSPGLHTPKLRLGFLRPEPETP